MVLQIKASNDIGTGIQADLGTTDDLFVAVGVTVGSTDDTTVVGTGSGHNVHIDGTVAGQFETIRLGDTNLSDIQQTLLITESGRIVGVAANNTSTVLIFGDNSEITNRGTISTLSNGLVVGGDGAFATTTINNSGLIEAADFAIMHATQSVSSVALNNTGEIRAGFAAYYSFSGAATTKDLITNSGLMVGVVHLGSGDDLYDGRAGRVLGTVEGGAGNDTIFGGVLGESLFGDVGADLLDGGGGDDVLDGGTEADTMLGGAGNDTFVVGEAGDVVSESGGSGIDIVGSNISFNLANTTGAVENLTLLAFATALNGLGNAFNNSIVGNSFANILSGQNGNDSLVGNAGIDTLNGGLGNDVLDGGLDGDKMFGAAGNDTFVVGEAGDIVSESGGSGIDRVQSTISFNLANTARAVGAIENLTLVNLATALNGTGNAFNNTIAGNSFANTLLGQNGNDNLIGNAGSCNKRERGCQIQLL